MWKDREQGQGGEGLDTGQQQRHPVISESLVRKCVKVKEQNPTGPSQSEQVGPIGACGYNRAQAMQDFTRLLSLKLVAETLRKKQRTASFTSS